MGTVCARQHRDDGSNANNSSGNNNSTSDGNLNQSDLSSTTSERENALGVGTVSSSCQQNSQRIMETMSMLASKSYRNNIYCACDNYYCVNNYDINVVNGIFRAKIDHLNKRIEEKKRKLSEKNVKNVAIEIESEEEEKKLYFHKPKTMLQLCVEAVANGIVNGKITSIKSLPQDLAQQVFDHLITNNRLTDTMMRTCFKDSSLVNLDLSKIRCIDDSWADTLMMLASSSSPSKESTYSPCSSQSKIDVNPLMSGLSASHSDDFPHIKRSASDGDSCSRTSLPILSGASPLASQTGLCVKDDYEQFFYGIERIKLSSCRDIGMKTMNFVSHAPMITELLLDGCVNINDELLESIKDNVKLQNLTLSGCISITSQGLNKATSKLSSLKTLRLDSCWNVNKLSFLGRFRQIETLSLGWCYNVGDQDVNVLKSLVNLTSLDISKTSITDNGLTEILSYDASGEKGSLKPFSHLKLDGCNITGASLKLLGESPRSSKIRELSLQWCLINDSDLECLSTLQYISSLNLSYTQVSCQGMKHVAALHNLSSLKLDSCNISDFGVQYLTNRPRKHTYDSKTAKSNITELDLSDTNISNNGLKSITEKMPGMKCLNLSYTAINDDGVEHLKALSSLTSLNLDSHSITDSSLRHLSQLTTIRHLDLFGSKVTDNGLRLICTLTFSNLKSLEVCGGGVTDVGVRYISRSMALLESLNLANNHRISDEAMPSICLLKNLKNLNLTHSRVTSEGILHLLNLRKLESLSVHECKISKSSISKLQQSIRSLKSIGAMNMKTTSGLTFSALFDLRQL